MDTLPNELVVMLYRMCDSVGKLKLFVTWSRVLRTGLRPPILQNVLITSIRDGSSLGAWRRELQEPLKLFHVAVKHNNLGFVQTFTSRLIHCNFKSRDFRHPETKKINSDFVIWAARNNVYIRNIKGANMLLLYCKYSTDPNICIMNHSQFITTEILDVLKCTAFIHRVWEIREHYRPYVSAEVYYWFQSHGFPHMKKLRVDDRPQRPVSQRIRESSSNGGELNWTLYRYDYERKFMRLASLELLQKAWEHVPIPYREDIYTWAINSGTMDWNDESCIEEIIASGNPEMFETLASKCEIQMLDMLQYAKLPRLLDWLKSQKLEIALSEKQKHDLQSGECISDPEVLIWLYQTGVFSASDIANHAFQHVKLIPDMIRKKMFSHTDILEIIKFITRPTNTGDKNMCLLYAQTLKKILKRGYELPARFVESGIMYDVLLSQLVERNKRYPHYS